MLHCVNNQPEWLPKNTMLGYLQEDVFFKTNKKK